MVCRRRYSEMPEDARVPPPQVVSFNHSQLPPQSPTHPRPETFDVRHIKGSCFKFESSMIHPIGICDDEEAFRYSQAEAKPRVDVHSRVGEPCAVSIGIRRPWCALLSASWVIIILSYQSRSSDKGHSHQSWDLFSSLVRSSKHGRHMVGGNWIGQ